MSDKKDTSPQFSGECSNSPEDDLSVVGASSSTDPSLLQIREPAPPADGEMRRAAASLIEKYYFQLKDGCGNPECNNPECASSGNFRPMSNDEAAGTALKLFSKHAKLCSPPPPPLPPGAKSRLGHVTTDHDRRHSDDDTSQPRHSPSGTAPVPSPIHDVDVDSGSEMDCSSSSPAHTTAHSSTKKKSSSSLSSSSDNSSVGLTVDRLRRTIEDCAVTAQYAALRILLRKTFSSEIALKFSFLRCDGGESPQEEDKIKDKRKSVKSQLKTMDINSEAEAAAAITISKEEIRSTGSDLDKDVDSLEDMVSLSVKDKDMDGIEDNMQATKCCGGRSASSEDVPNTNLELDIEAVRRAYDILYQVPENEFSSTLMDAMRQLLRDSLNIQLRVFPQRFQNDNSIINIFIILLENPRLTSADYTEEVLGDICKVMAQLKVEQQAALVKYMSAHWRTEHVHRLLESLHQLITIRLLSTVFSKKFTINHEETITAATVVMLIVYYVAICTGDLDRPLLVDVPPSSTKVPFAHNDLQLFGAGSSSSTLDRFPPWEPLGKCLGIHPLDARKPAIPFDAFCDDFLSDQLEMDKDFAYFKADPDQFSFLSYPFILTPATKALGLYYDNRIRMYSERRMSIYQTIMDGTPANPYLSLRIRRDHIIADALVELELVALENPGDLKKQLVVEFEGEQGIDEGGVSKEFFQLIIEQIFNPDYGMFCLNSETRTFWFNPTSFESEAQFTLVGVVLGLAIYNNVILDLHFPPVVYKKLLGKPGTVHDLKDWNTTLYRSLLDLLNYEGDDMEDIFMQTFRVGYEDIFGVSLHHDLVPNGNNIGVTQANKEEFVRMYGDFLLNGSVERQFNAFRRGFVMVTCQSPLQRLFLPHELELLVCGSKHYDFSELKKSTEYEGGYDATSAVILWFWDLVDGMSADKKQQLLQFTTGSARVPVGGLARLKLVISRHGPDTERLPTAHTCFNVLLLPEYATKEKLHDRLMKAITYAQGFGML